MFIMLSCLGLFELYRVVYFSVICFCLLVCWPSDWLGRLTFISFLLKGFSTKTRLKSYLL